MQEQEKGVRRPDFPEQGMFDPATGANITGDIIQASGEDVEKKLEELYAQARKRATTGEAPGAIYAELSPKVEGAVSCHFNSMKLPTDQNFLKERLDRLAEAAGVAP